MDPISRVLDNLPLPEFTTSTARQEFGIKVTVHILKDWHVASHIQRIRKRHHIEPPEDQEGLAYNLEQFPPDQFLRSSRRIARQYWDHNFLRGLFAKTEATLPAGLLQLLGAPIRLMVRRWVLRTFARVFALEDIIETSARMIARFIVADLQEIPAPVCFPASAVRVYDLGEDTPLLAALILPHAWLPSVFQQIRQVHRAHFVEGERDTIPTDFVETTWLRYAGERLADDPDYQRAPWQTLAQLSFDLDPARRPPDGASAAEYERLLNLRADSIEHNFPNYEARLPRLLPYKKNGDS